MSDKTLAQLYAEHKGKVSDKWTLYLSEYDRIFSEYRAKPIRMLEIGIQNGGSLEIWSKYFTYAQKFIGCDINPDCARLSYEDPRIDVVLGDANVDTVQSVILEKSPTYDLIIDDGSHCSSDIVRSFAKYFPYLTDGGVFVVEDLHCSYWQEFEGGLFDPFSSLTFFKRLSDVVNYEHWGVEKARTDILGGFFEKYGFEIDEETLQHIHSVEFINSICVIRKSTPKHNMLGTRYIAGSLELVVPGILERRSNPDPALDQTSNEWAARSMPPDEELLLRLNEWAARDEQIDNILSSRSWKVTAPLRAIGNAFRVVSRLPGRLVKTGVLLRPHVLKAFREPRWGMCMWRKALTILHASGWQGLKRTLQNTHDYQEWIRRYDTLTDEGRETMRANIDTIAHQPLISVVMPVYNPKPEWLIEAIESVRKQLYLNWELCIADDASSDKAIRLILERYTKEDSRIKVVFREQNGHIAAASNSALELATGEWVALLDHDDLLSEHALYWVVDAVNRNPGVHMIYSDEDKIDSKGRRNGPYFKCDWNIDLFYSHNIITHLGVYQTALVRLIGGFRAGLEGAQDYDLALRYIELIEPKQIYHIPRILYHWRMHTESTAQSADAKPYAMLAGERALNEHFQRQDVNATAELVGHCYRVHYALPDPQPMVSLIIPTRNKLHLVRQCIESIFKKTTYPNYEILVVDNNSDEPDVLSYLDSLSSNPRIRIIRDNRPFNFSALNNAAVDVAKGQLVGLINNDIEVISPDWLTEMVSHALRPEVGAVGARLWYPNDTLQHGGIVLGIGGCAGHASKGLPKGSLGYIGRMSMISGFSAVTAACLVVKKSLYKEVGGLNERDLKVALNDVDFCLRVLEAGYRNIWTPYAELYHHESASRGYEDTPEKHARFSEEVRYMNDKWGKLLKADPAYSPNLTLDHEDFSYAWPPRVEVQL